MSNKETLQSHNTQLRGLVNKANDLPDAKQPVIEPLEITENGTYTAGDGVDGYSPITVNVAGSGGDGLEWTRCMFTNTRNIHYGNGVWVACTPLEGLYYSTDGMTWTQSNITSGRFYQAYYSNGVWFACSYSDGIYSSTDGKTWSQSNIDSGKFNYVYGDGCVFVACGDTGAPYSALVGLDSDAPVGDWEKATSTIDGSFLHVSVANAMWVACRSEGGVYYSSYFPGVWTCKLEHSSLRLNSIHNANGIWVGCGATGGVYYSADGKSWTQSNITEGVGYFAHNANGLWVAGCGNALYYSADGMNWTLGTNTTDRINHAHYANGLWVACGDSNCVYYSSDGKTWVEGSIPGGDGRIHWCVTNANGIWVLAGQMGIYYSKS